MKIALLYVASVDGKITKWGNSPSIWASEEDAKHFHAILDKSKLIVMGSKSFKPTVSKPIPGVRRIVLTRTPQKYTEFAVPSQLEFTSESPEVLVERLEKEGFKEMLLVSGTRVTSEFFKKHLVDELWLTIEPKLFGSGNGLITDEQFDISLKLMDVKQLNNQGTLLLQYKVQK
jgi:dihydrofolate reductase